MFKYLVNLYGWGDASVCDSQIEFKEKEKIIVENESGRMLGEIKQEIDLNNGKKKHQQYDNYEKATIIRLATKKDLERFDEKSEKRKEVLKKCREEAKRMRLNMKFVDTCVTLGKGVIIVSFIADGRVDFRQLVKNLSRLFHCSIKMHQIGSRDEARKLGGCGVCGKELCCSKFLGEIPSISTEMAKIQQVSQRGSDRISGVCGRLLCCLSYEAEQYREMMKGMPEVGSRIKTEKGEGRVVEVNPLKQEIRIKVEDQNEYISIKKEDFKK
ncbi:MAG TPA: stage 0 sporulation protein [Candidatus Moranbacteria bacterium]|nr:stage 0 sporulation protein [Candidatus Moranbacteria bacterium]